MDKREILTQCRFGSRIAEEESSYLHSYFVETDQWQRVFNGEVDIIYGPKGSGKSAIYTLLLAKSETLFDKNIITLSAENPRGTPVFRDIEHDPPTSENEFVGLWKLYILTLVGSILREYDATDKNSNKLIESLKSANLLTDERNLSKILKSVFEYAKRIFRPTSVESTYEFDPLTGLPKGITGKISFSEPNTTQQNAGIVSINDLMSLADSALKSFGFNVWILLDRLDVAFADSRDLEENALRALFRAYLDLQSIEYLRLKIFIRSDIWKRITAKGFREASHITKHITISWDRNTLLNLIVRRIVQNDSICVFFKLNKPAILNSSEQQLSAFYQIFPPQVEVGRNKSQTLEWIIGRTRDGTTKTAPRELIHLLNSIRERELRRHEIGFAEIDSPILFSKSSIKEALHEVSKTRLEQTIFAEYPSLKAYIEKLKSEKTVQHPKSLCRIWNLPENECIPIAEQLIEIGFFEYKGPKEYPFYGIPFLYRVTLEMVQGTAEPLMQTQDKDQEEE